MLSIVQGLCDDDPEVLVCQLCIPDLGIGEEALQCVPGDPHVAAALPHIYLVPSPLARGGPIYEVVDPAAQEV
eukprot:167454-Heterocapsa_arctica.AAC.1